MKKCYFLILLFALPSIVAGQSLLEKKVTFQVEEETLSDALLLLSEMSGVSISFSRSLLSEEENITDSWENVPLRIILKDLLKNSALGFELIGNQVVLFKTERENQPKFTISGYVEDIRSGERLIGAHIYDLSTQKGALTNAYGFFSLTLTRGAVELRTSYLGYEVSLKSLYLEKDEHLNIQLVPSLTLAEVVISADKNSGGSETLNYENLSLDAATSLPTLGGESDLLQVALSKSGVQSGADGIGGLHVRGGSPDQNLVMMDDVPVYNPTHSWGVYSIFNTNAVQSARFFKSGFPSNYGGRLSSVLDVRTKDGNYKKYGGEVEVGLVSGKFTYEGPIVKDKASFFFSARRAFLDAISRPYYRITRKERGIDGTIGYYFYDLNMKLNFKAGKKDKIYFSIYNGKDNYYDDQFLRAYATDTLAYYEEDFDQDWGNIIGALRWNRVWSSKLFSNTTLTYSKYFYQSKDLKSIEIYSQGDLSFDIISLSQYNSNIEERSAKTDFTYYHSPDKTFSFGGRFAQYSFQPGAVSVSEEVQTDSELKDSIAVSLDTFWRRASLKSDELDVYAEGEFSIFDKGVISPGFYFAAFRTGEETYYSLQPRIRFRWNWNERLQSGVCGETMTQFLHLLTASSIGLPNDLWVSATQSVKPQKSWQVSAWWSYLLDKEYHLKIEGYYKRLAQLVEFQESSSFVLNASNWENNVVTGEGWNYGVEVELGKTGEKTSGWINYTYAYANRRFADINFNESFPYRYDRRHVVNVSLFHKLSSKWELSAKWIFSTGLATSLPVGRYVTIPGVSLPPIEVFTFESRNSFRMPAYHHLDIGAKCSWTGSLGEQAVKLGIYNIYFRKNPIYYELREDNLYYQRFIPPLMPALSYIVKI